MKYQKLCDSHVHSVFSHDGRDPVMMLCDHAVNLGLHTLTITDHCECNLYIERNYETAIQNSFLETQRAAAALRGKLQLYKGIELGQATQNPQAANAILSACQFDFVLGSLHNLNSLPDFYLLDYDTLDIHALLSTYFDELEELIEWGNFDSLSHLTYPLRYIVGEHKTAVSYERYQDRVDTILKALITRNKALELNTSGLRQAIGKTLPCPTVIQRFKALGGKYLTLGSDAHRWSDVGAGLEQGCQIARQVGFEHITIFVNREPVLIPIES